MRFGDLHLQQRAGQFVTQNSAGLLTAGGVFGVGATAFLTARASFKAAAKLREQMAIRQAYVNAENAEREESDEPTEYKFAPDFTKTEMAKLTWKFYVPPVLAGTLTMGSIIMANRVSTKRAAALAAAYAISESRLQEYKDKVTAKIGINKERAVRDDIAADRVNKNPPSKEVIILGSGDVLCLDSLTGRYFHSTIETIKQAEYKIHTELNSTHYASLSEFYDMIGLEPTSFSDAVGWNGLDTGMFEVSFSHTLTPDNRPCLVLDYTNLPKPDFHKLY